MLRIYVASLSDYNAGRLHGAWIDVGDEDVVRQELAEMLRHSKYPNVMVTCPDCEGSGCDTCKDTGAVPSAEEWAIHDHEGFGNLIEEYTSIRSVVELAEAIEEHGEAFITYAEDVGVDFAMESFEEAYQGEWDSEREFGEQLADDLGIIADDHPLSMYIDWDAWARDLFIGDYSSESTGRGTIYVFRRM